MSNATIVALASGLKNTRGVLFEDHISKCCALGKILLPPIRTLSEYMAMLQDQQNVELRKHLRSYNAAFTFTSIRV